MILAVVSVTLPLVSVCQAQEQQAEEFGIMPMPGPEGIKLVIVGEVLHKSTADNHNGWVGYNIYRKTGEEADFRKLNKKVISRVNTLDDLTAVVGDRFEGVESLVGLTKDEIWDAVDHDIEAIAFVVYVSDLFAESIGQLLWDYDVTVGAQYEYTITRVKNDGTESEPSHGGVVVHGTPYVPLIGPAEIKTFASERSISLTWEKHPDDESTFCYYVYRASSPEASFVRINPAPLVVTASENEGAVFKGAFSDTTMMAGRVYYYTVVSVDYAGNESARQPVIALKTKDLQPPRVPQNVQALPSNSGMKIIWDPVLDKDLAGYNVYRSDEAEAGFVVLNKVILPRDSGFYFDNSPTVATKYYYHVTSIDLSGNESASSARLGQHYRNFHRPMPPQGLKTEPADKGASLSWMPNTESDLQGYYVYRAEEFQGIISQVSPLLPDSVTSYVDQGEFLSERGNYYYLVKAMNYSGVKSRFSVPAIVSPKVTELHHAPRSFFGFQDPVGNHLIWSSSTDIQVTGYNIYRAEEATPQAWTLLTATAVGRTEGSYVDNTAEVSVPYLYRLVSLNKAAEEGAGSHHVSLTRFVTAPMAPGTLRVSKAPAGIQLDWTPTRESTVVGYRVYRRSDTEEAVLLTRVDLSRDVAQFLDPDAVPQKRYYYSISSVARDGREGLKSTETAFWVE